MKSFLAGIICLFPIIVLSQVQYNYSPAVMKRAFPSEYSTKKEQRLASDLQGIPLKGKARKEVKELYEDRSENLDQRVKNGEFLFDEIIEPYCQRVINRIFDANPELPARDITLLVSRSSVPNASCLGEGTLVLNLGLLSRLTSEGQLAFTLCHELAHYVRNHVEENVLERVSTFYSKETQDKLKEISRSEYNRTAQAMALLREYTYDAKRHSRHKESEADSIGLKLFLNCGYDPGNSLQLLSILDGVDFEKYDFELKLKERFGELGYPPKEKWFEYEPDTSFMFGKGTDAWEWDEDSLKTHPKIDQRMEALARQLSAIEGDANLSLEADAFATLTQLCDFEMIHYEYHAGAVGEAMYQSLLLLELYPENVFLHAMIGHCLTGLHKAKADHRLSSVLDINHRNYSDHYNQFLHFANSLRLKDLVGLSQGYLDQRKEEFAKDAFYGFAYLKMALISEQVGNPRELRRQYEEAFPQSPYKKEIQQLFE